MLQKVLTEFKTHVPFDARDRVRDVGNVALLRRDANDTMALAEGDDGAEGKRKQNNQQTPLDSHSTRIINFL